MRLDLACKEETMENKTVRLKVAGWSNPRFGRIENGRIMFEVMSWECACPTCFTRLETVKNRMKSNDVLLWQIDDITLPERRGAISAVLVVEPKEMPKRLDTFLSELLKLQISEIAAQQ